MSSYSQSTLIILIVRGPALCVSDTLLTSVRERESKERRPPLTRQIHLQIIPVHMASVPFHKLEYKVIIIIIMEVFNVSVIQFYKSVSLSH